MKDLCYRTSYGMANTVLDGKVINKIDEVLRDRYKNTFNIQVYGHAILPNEAHSTLFRCRNLVANMCCVYIGRDEDNVIAAHLSEAWYMTRDIDKELVVIEGIRFDTSCEEIPEVLKALYNIVTYEVKEHYNASDVVVYWALDDSELEIVKNNTNWCSDGTLKIEDCNFGYVILEQ